MHFRLVKKPAFRTLGIIFILGVIAIIAFLLYFPRSGSNQEMAAEKARLKEIFSFLDADFWEDPTLGLNLSGQAIRLSEKTGDSASLARAYLKKAGCFQLLDQGDSALPYYTQGLAVAERIHNDSLVAKSKNGIANYYLRKEDYQQAMRYLTEALKTSERVNYKHCTGLIYNGLGLVSISLKEYDKAISCFEKARAICKEIGDISNEAGITLNIANCYAEQNELGKARQFYEDNLATLLRVNDSSQIVLAYINLAIVNRNLGDIRASFSYLEKALKFLESYKNQSLLCTTMLEVGTSYLQSGNLPMAKKYLEQSLGISTGTLSMTNSMEALSRLAEVAEKEGNYAKAYQYYKQYTVLKDSVMNDETRKSIDEIRWQYDIQKRDYENQLLNKKYEIKKRQNVTLGVVFASFFIVVLLIGILIWLSHKNLRKSYRMQEMENTHLQEKIQSDEKINYLEKLRLTSEIEAKNKELTSASLQIVAKNKILSDISKMTNDFYNAKSIDKESYNGLQKIVRENLNIDKDWEQFKELFEKVHQDFFTGLKAAFPELTENELRLCAYLKINLQNKEIAKILNVSPQTVTTSRYRVRKKFRLDNKTVLEDFLRSF